VDLRLEHLHELVIMVALATVAIEDLGGVAWLEDISPGLAQAEARTSVSGLLSAHRTMITGSALCAALAVTERD
jgi:hypothetical protein